jgi:hypothetical protein
MHHEAGVGAGAFEAAEGQDILAAAADRDDGGPRRLCGSRAKSGVPTGRKAGRAWRISIQIGSSA